MEARPFLGPFALFRGYSRLRQLPLACCVIGFTWCGHVQRFGSYRSFDSIANHSSHSLLCEFVHPINRRREPEITGRSCEFVVAAVGEVRPEEQDAGPASDSGRAEDLRGRFGTGHIVGNAKLGTRPPRPAPRPQPTPLNRRPHPALSHRGISAPFGSVLPSCTACAESSFWSCERIRYLSPPTPRCSRS